MFDRAYVRSIVNEICSHNIYTQFSVQGERLQVITENGVPLTQEQKDLIVLHRAMLLEYFTTPPDMGDLPCNEGHSPIPWELYYGSWVCGACFALRRELLQESKKREPITPAQVVNRPSSARNYWRTQKAM